MDDIFTPLFVDCRLPLPDIFVFDPAEDRRLSFVTMAKSEYVKMLFETFNVSQRYMVLTDGTILYKPLYFS